MRRKTAAVAIAAGMVIALGLTACGSNKPSSNSSGGGGGNATPAFNAAIDKVFNPSTKKGGTLRFAHSGEFDSTDGADTYYGYSWDFIRLYGRALTMFAPKPGKDGNKLVPDLAESLGQPSADAKTWTYKLKAGVKFEDGTPVTSKDVKYAVERSLDKDTFVNGPTYFNDFLDLQGYKSPYKDSDPNKLGLKAIETPDDRTIVFHLAKPFGGFDYLAMLPATIPVPAAKDTGTKYKEHPVSTGPYKFDVFNAGKNFALVRNTSWDAATDPNRTALPDRIEVALNTNAQDIDDRLLSGNLDVGIEGTGVQAATQGKILGNQDLKKNADLASIARLWFSVINADVAPLDNIHCRKAIEYATDHEGYQRAYGGPTGGDIATNLLPPQIPGAKKIDLYNFASKPNGDVDAAKKELADCGQPNGFAINVSYRAERPKEKATAESLQQSLSKVGINLTLKPFPSGDYAKLYAGKPDFAKNNKLGIIIYGWGADWPDGFGFLQQIVDSRAIRPGGGNTNLGIKIPDVDALIDKALVTTEADARNDIWGQIDQKVMENAEALPGLWAKALIYRPPSLTNVYVNDGLGGFYDYAWMGVKQ
ncbi:MAG: ABC transporter substrate-binding protein [Actinobacteria bacterium 13_1_20CM_3_71_11]|nr:MAG: ABC transporter substrate-binding protein [Actinobacteria bacterium 13_1_20CM_3_71_11]